MEKVDLTIISLSLEYHKNWGGSEELWYQTIFVLEEEGYKIEVSYNKTPRIHENIIDLRKKGINVYLRKPIHKYLNWVAQLALQLFKFKLYESNNYLTKILLNIGNPYKKSLGVKNLWVINIAYVFTLAKKVQLLFLLLNSSQNYCIIFHWQPDFYWKENINRDLIKKVLLRAKHLFFVSERQKKIIERQLALSFENASVIYNPINLEKLQYIPFPKEKTMQLGVVARLETKDKGQDLLLEVLGSEKWKNRNWNLNLYGEGVDESYLKTLSEYYQIESKIFFHGYTNIYKAWEKNHICIVSSYVEGTPIALIEALYCGRVTVVTDIGGNSEWVKEGVNGFVAEAPLTKYLDNALERAWESRVKWEQMGKIAHQMTKARYNKRTKLSERLIELL